MSQKKIQILADPESDFLDNLSESLESLQYLSDKVEEIVFENYQSDIEVKGQLIKRSALVSNLNLNPAANSDQMLIFITNRGFTQSDSILAGNISIVSLYQSTSAGDSVPKRIFNAMPAPFTELFSDAEKDYYLNCGHSILSPTHTSIRSKFKLKNVMLTVQGFNTEGEWEKDAANELLPKQVTPFSVNYGNFKNIASEKIRLQKRDEILAQYEKMLSNYPRAEFRHTIIAHSFGTYGVIDMLLNCDVSHRPDTIILINPIVSRSAKLWKSLLDMDIRIYLEVSKKDNLCKAAGLLRLTGAKYAGLSGWLGARKANNIDVEKFADEQYNEKIRSLEKVEVINLNYKTHNHTSLLAEDHYVKRWLPLIDLKLV